MTEQLSEDPWTDEVCKDWENIFHQRAADSRDVAGYVISHMDLAPPAVREYWERRAAIEIKLINTETQEVYDPYDQDR